MIKKSEVRAFKKKKLEDFSFLKRFTLREIREEVNQLVRRSNFKFKTKPFKHQLVSFYIGACRKYFLFLLDMGLGKTKILLDIISFRKIKRTLVLVPYDINIEGWEEEVTNHSDLKCVPMYGTTEERWKLVEQEGNVFVLNYIGLLHMVCKLDKKKGKFKAHRPSIIKLAKLFDAILLDELHMAKNSKVVTFRVLSTLTGNIDIRYGATGTPFGRDPLDLWALFFIIDRGETLGATLGLFREAFFKKVYNDFGFAKYLFDDKYKRHLYRRMHNSSIRYSDDECQDLPSKIESVKRFRLYGPALEYFNQALSGIIEADGDSHKVDNAYIRMRQITSGFLQLKDEEGNKLPIIFFPENPKLALLRTMCDSLSLKRKMVIFLRYVPSGDLVCKMLDDAGFNYATAVGKTKDSVKEIKKFKNDKSCRFLVASVDGGAGVGGNFQVANHVVFFESPESPILRKQCYKRTLRNGQKRRVRITDLVGSAGRVSIEQKILDYLAEGEDLFQALLEGKVKLEPEKFKRKRVQLEVT